MVRGTLRVSASLTVRGRRVRGLFAIFDGPARAARCACAIRDAVTQLDLEVRAGLHTGECEVAGSKVSGIAVHAGARIAAAAAPQEVLASGTVRDLVAGPVSASTTAAAMS